MPTLSCHNQFAFCKSFNCDIIAVAMQSGYLPMACSLDRAAFGGMRHVLLTKNHHERCVLDLTCLKVSASVTARRPGILTLVQTEKNVKKRAKKYVFSQGLDFRGVVSGCHAQHGQSWLFPPLADAFERMQTLPDPR
jgi:hypothetical protein